MHVNGATEGIKKSSMQLKGPYGAKYGRMRHMMIWQREQTSKHLHLASIHTAGFIVITINNPAHPWPEDTNPPHAHRPPRTTWPTDLHMEFYTWQLAWFLEKKTSPWFQQCLTRMSAVHTAEPSKWNRKYEIRRGKKQNNIHTGSEEGCLWLVTSG